MNLKRTLSALILCALFYAPVYSEVIFLRDGSIVEGRIVSDTASSLMISDSAGKQRVLQRGSILRILYTELKLGKIYVQKRDGEHFVAYMVDEDRNSYTFRKDLYKADEFRLQRSDVLFMAEKNPSGLKGEADIDNVKLKWLPPYDAVKQYNIYYKTSKNEKYKKEASTMSKEYTLSGLNGNTTYYIIVTSVDSENYESLPSNELKVTTKNGPPEPPENIRVKIKTDKKRGKMDVRLTWNRGYDEDGKVKYYNIYQRGEDKPVKTWSTYYSLKNLDKEKVYTFNLTSVDDMGAESSKSGNVNTYDYFGLNVSLQPCFIYPFGNFAKIHKYGYGALLMAEIPDVFFDDLTLGAAAGYIMYEGSDEFENSEVESSYMIPVLFTAGYRFSPFSRLSIVPTVMAGGSYNVIKYKVNVFGMESREKSSFEPMLQCGLDIDFEITYRFYITAGAGYGAVIEKSGVMQFASGRLGVKVRL